MEFLSDSHFWGRWGSIVLLDLVLAGDNALVIALATRTLPARQQFWGRVVGTLGAIGLRLIFIVAITWLLTLPLLRFLGGALLVWIAIKLVHQPPHHAGKVRQGTTIAEAIWIIMLADLVMSFDNVMAISGVAQGDFVLVVFGLLLSLPLVVWGSGLLARLMNRVPFIIWLGGGVLGWVAMKMIFNDPLVVNWLGETLAQVLHQFAPWLLGTVIALLGWRFARNLERSKDAA
ncbi:Integral membrane protein TerC [Chthoniobacter flavus Ellin428]|uniref:Integral membrane protein TerC n=1 Tax=Chthoniobacter flavus Ellin428 TaxID=497964 RepID=B4DC43_9BACT|nr:TerC family protein [Chthoniobacter flavus]EDY16017.1 Integral membrane protein TerC [Chthoniobacter flavus Ellin428]TCO85274.1 YjbE family integral membrane protein [Chthoniobacter flavus]